MDNNIKCTRCHKAGRSPYENTVIQMTGYCPQHQGDKDSNSSLSQAATKRDLADNTHRLWGIQSLTEHINEEE